MTTTGDDGDLPPTARPSVPAAPTPLIGRAHELRTMRDYVLRDEVRLLTLTGPGGVGKTRLAVAVAADLAAAFPDGVFFVDLSSLRESSLVPSVIARALDVREAGDVLALDRLAAYLRDRRALLVLDNFEQVLPAATALATVLAACPQVTLLVTSREPLRLRWEQTMPVGPLALPDPAHLPGLDTLAAIPSVALFMQRARAVRPAVVLTADNAAAVATLCVRLDGLPLALELAAARLATLTPQALLARLEPRLPLLRWIAADLPARQQTLRATIDWSYTLLTGEEQALFRRLSAFAGGWTLAAAVAVAMEGTDDARGERDALDSVGALLDKGLLYRTDEPDETPRFHMLETIREYGAEQLKASGEEDTVRRRHAGWYVALAEDGWWRWYGPEQGAWLAQLEREGDNLRAALRWAIGHGAIETEARLCASLWHLWIRGHLGEGWRWMEGALGRAAAVPLALRARLLNGAASVALPRGDYARAALLYGEALALRRSLGDAHGVAYALNNLGMVATERGDTDGAATLLEESVARFRTLGHAHGLAFALDNLGCVLAYRGQEARAVALLEESLALWRSMGNTQGIVETLGGLGLLAERRGEHERAIALHQEGVALLLELGTERRLMAAHIEGLAAVAAARGHIRRAAGLWGMAAGLRDRIGAPLAPVDRDAYDRAVAAARDRIDAEEFATAWANGGVIALGEVGAEAQAQGQAEAQDALAGAVHPPDALLSLREAEVLGLVAAGLSNRDIGARLFIAERTAKFHVTSIFQKLGADNRTQAVALARQRGFL